jgi:hypothetical protein
MRRFIMNRLLGKKIVTSSMMAALTLGSLAGCVVREEAPAPVAVGPAPGPAPAPAPAPQPADGDVVVQDAPPPDVVEVQPAQPGPEFVWVGGFWAWNGYRYAWRPGYWHRPPYGYHVWVHDHWARGPRGYFWVRGHWG